MSKSRPYTIDGKKYFFSFDENSNLNGISRSAPRGAVKEGAPLDPNSTEFSTISESSEALNALNVNKFKGNKRVYQTAMQVAPTEELTKVYNEKTKKNTNEQKVDEETAIIDEAISTFQNYKDTGVGNASEMLAYPFNFDTSQDHLKITRHEYRRPDINMSKGSTEYKTRNIKDRETKNQRRVEFETKTSNAAGDTVVGKLLGSILLPMPKVADVNGVEWGKSELTISGLAGLGAISKLQRFTGKDPQAVADDKAALEAIKGDTQGGINVAGSSATEFRRALTAQTLSGLAGAVTGSNLDADTFLARTSGRVLNPNAEVLFQGPVIRDFSFSFVMIARSQKEGSQIRRIIRFLKLGMAPKFRSTTFLNNPDVFKLEYRSGEGVLKTVNRFNPGGLALTTMSVDYAPNGYWSAYRDSQPVALKMDLAFTELRPIYESDQQDTPMDSVGY